MHCPVQALQVFPVRSEVLAACGVAQTVRAAAFQGGDKTLRALLAALLRRWDAGSGVGPAGAGNGSAAAAAAGGRAANGAAKQAPANGQAAAAGRVEPSPEILESDRAAEQVILRHRKSCYLISRMFFGQLPFNHS